MQFSKKDDYELSKRIRRIVDGSGMTKTAFAKIIGVTQVNLNAWIQGYGAPSLPNLMGIAKVGGTTVDALLDGCWEVELKR